MKPRRLGRSERVWLEVKKKRLDRADAVAQARMLCSRLIVIQRYSGEQEKTVDYWMGL